MTGEDLKTLILDSGYTIHKMAELMGISDQALRSKLNTKDVKVSLLKSVAEVSNKSVYYWLGMADRQKKAKEDAGYKDKYLTCMERCNALQSQIIMLNHEKKESAIRKPANKS